MKLAKKIAKVNSEFCCQRLIEKKSGDKRSIFLRNITGNQIFVTEKHILI